MMKIIKHQKQGEMDCVCTCIAMVAGMSRRSIRRKYHNRFMNDNDYDINHILDDLKIKYRICNPNENIKLNCVYLVTVPSVNMPGWFHQIIIDTREGFEILDPNRGLKGRKYYVLHVSPKSKNQIKLNAFILDCEVYI
ncbi:TPA: hypothetical protein ACODLE_001579 [Salmonella enterica subsp. enterica serovar Infantis]